MKSQQSTQCPSCGKVIQEDFNVCPYCGKTIKKVCHNCGAVLEDEYINCPYCGVKVKGEASHSAKVHIPDNYKNSFASLLSSIGNFVIKLWEAVKRIALVVWDFLKKFSHKALEWLKSIQWGKFGEQLKLIGGKALVFLKAAFQWIKKALGKLWTFLKMIFSRLRDLVARILEKKLSPETAKKAALGIIIFCVILCLLLALILFSKPDTDAPEEDQQVVLEPTSVVLPSVDPSEQKWLVMIYADADDQVLENDIYFDVNEAESAGSTDRVQIVTQIDRYTGGYTGDGDWSGTRRYFIQQDDDLHAVNSELAADLGELDMGSTDTLVDFAVWAVQTYPADRYVLILSDHGSGWTGGWSDHDPVNPTGNYITLNQLDSALGEIIAQTGIGKFELVGLDACLMGMLEVYNSLEPHARYAVASEEVEPSMGWAYDYFLTKLTESPEMDGAGLAQAIVDGYIQQDLRIQNDMAYKELLEDYQIPEEAGKELVADKFSERVTLSAVDLSVIPEFNQKFNQLLTNIKEIDQGIVAEARSYSQAFYNVFDDGLPSPFIDLMNFLNVLAQNNADETISSSINEVNSLLNEMVISEVHGSRYPGAFGVSLYFPISQHYWEETEYSHELYPLIADRFANASLWDDFLAYHYAGQDFGQGIPSIDSRTRAPGYSEITISKPVITPVFVSGDNPKVNIQADVSGDRIAYLYVVNMYRHGDRLLFYGSDFITGDSEINVDGVVYPQYEMENGVKHINLDYEIYATAVSDGDTVAFAVVQPDEYGFTPEDSIYSVKGFYIYADTGQKVSAMMYFYNYGDNEMRNIIGLYGSQEKGISPAEITPKKGDSFQFIDTWWAVDENGNVTDEIRDGNILTFGDQPFRMGVAPQFVYPGDYSIAIAAEDMDGNQTFSFAPILIE